MGGEQGPPEAILDDGEPSASPSPSPLPSPSPSPLPSPPQSPLPSPSQSPLPSPSQSLPSSSSGEDFVRAVFADAPSPGHRSILHRIVSDDLGNKHILVQGTAGSRKTDLCVRDAVISFYRGFKVAYVTNYNSAKNVAVRRMQRWGLALEQRVNTRHFCSTRSGFGCVNVTSWNSFVHCNIRDHVGNAVHGSDFAGKVEVLARQLDEPDFELKMQSMTGRCTPEVIIVDEAQDFSWRHMEVLIALLRKSPSLHHSLVVGDVEQIASVDSIDPSGRGNVFTLWPREVGFDVAPLRTNFRCPASHIALANRFMEPYRGTMATFGLMIERALPSERVGRGPRPIVIPMRSMRANGPAVRDAHIIDKLLRALCQERSLHPGDMAVICNTINRKPLLVNIERLLRARGCPVHLFETKHEGQRAAIDWSVAEGVRPGQRAKSTVKTAICSTHAFKGQDAKVVISVGWTQGALHQTWLDHDMTVARCLANISMTRSTKWLILGVNRTHPFEALFEALLEARRQGECLFPIGGMDEGVESSLTDEEQWACNTICRIYEAEDNSIGFSETRLRRASLPNGYMLNVTDVAEEIAGQMPLPKLITSMTFHYGAGTSRFFEDYASLARAATVGHMGELIVYRLLGIGHAQRLVAEALDPDGLRSVDDLGVSFHEHEKHRIMAASYDAREFRETKGTWAERMRHSLYDVPGDGDLQSVVRRLRERHDGFYARVEPVLERIVTSPCRVAPFIVQGLMMQPAVLSACVAYADASIDIDALGAQCLWRAAVWVSVLNSSFHDQRLVDYLDHVDDGNAAVAQLIQSARALVRTMGDRPTLVEQSLTLKNGHTRYGLQGAADVIVPCHAILELKTPLRPYNTGDFPTAVLPEPAWVMQACIYACLYNLDHGDASVESISVVNLRAGMLWRYDVSDLNAAEFIRKALHHQRVPERNIYDLLGSSPPPLPPPPRPRRRREDDDAPNTPPSSKEPRMNGGS